MEIDLTPTEIAWSKLNHLVKQKEQKLISETTYHELVIPLRLFLNLDENNCPLYKETKEEDEKRKHIEEDLSDTCERLEILIKLRSEGHISDEEYYQRAKPYQEKLGLDQNNNHLETGVHENVSKIMDTIGSYFKPKTPKEVETEEIQTKIVWVKNKSNRHVIVNVYSGWLSFLKASKQHRVPCKEDIMISGDNDWGSDFQVELLEERPAEVGKETETGEEQTPEGGEEPTSEDGEERTSEGGEEGSASTGEERTSDGGEKDSADSGEVNQNRKKQPGEEKVLEVFRQKEIITAPSKMVIYDDRVVLKQIPLASLPQTLVIYEKNRQHWEEEDFYSILECPRKATKEEIKHSFFRLIRKYHPDRGGPEANVWMTRRVIQAYAVLGNEEERKKYDALLNNNSGVGFIRQFFSRSYWQQCYEDGRLKWIILQALLVVGGITLTACTGGAGLAVALPCAIIGGSMLSVGIGGYKYISGNKCAIDGVEWDEYKKVLITYGVAGGVAGAVSFGASAMVIPGLTAAGTGAVSGIVDGAVWGASGTISDGIVSGHYEELAKDGQVLQIAGDIAKGVAVGSILGGAIGGTVAGVVSGKAAELGGEVSGTIQRTAREGVSEITDFTIAALEGGGRAVRIAAKNLIDTVENKILPIEYHPNAPTEEIDPITRLPFLEEQSPLIISLPLNNHNFLIFQDEGVGLYIKMYVKYVIGDKEDIVIKKSREGVTLPYNATNVTVHFEVARAPKLYASVKKWDRTKNDWMVPTETHVFHYKEPVCRKYFLGGSLYYEKVVAVQPDED